MFQFKPYCSKKKNGQVLSKISSLLSFAKLFYFAIIAAGVNSAIVIISYIFFYRKVEPQGQDTRVYIFIFC